MVITVCRDLIHAVVCKPCAVGCTEISWEGTIVTANCNAGCFYVDHILSWQEVCHNTITTIDYSLCRTLCGTTPKPFPHCTRLGNHHGAMTCLDGAAQWLPKGDWSISCGPTSYDSSTHTLMAYCTGGNAQDVVFNKIILNDEDLRVGVRNVNSQLVVA